jgi:hypothetical protein
MLCRSSTRSLKQFSAPLCVCACVRVCVCAERVQKQAAGVKAIVLVPTNELVDQVKDIFQKLTAYCYDAVEVAKLNSDLSVREEKYFRVFFFGFAEISRKETALQNARCHHRNACTPCCASQSQGTPARLLVVKSADHQFSKFVEIRCRGRSGLGAFVWIRERNARDHRVPSKSVPGLPDVRNAFERRRNSSRFDSAHACGASPRRAARHVKTQRVFRRVRRIASTHTARALTARAELQTKIVSWFCMRCFVFA